MTSAEAAMRGEYETVKWDAVRRIVEIIEAVEASHGQGTDIVAEIIEAISE